ncbi:MAG: PAS domain-containing protein [Burkholderiaceae bacterium]|nr:PAS domain-containing protein [Burkholderiaceae bacterium]
MPPVTSSTFWRSLQTLNVSRVLVSLVLVLYVSLKAPKDYDPVAYYWFHEVAIAYVFIASGFVLLKLYFQKRFLLQLAAQITVDLTVISILYLSIGGSKSGLAILYLFPLAGVGILGSLTWALFFASAVTLFLLLENAYRVFQLEDAVPFSQAGLYGAVYFAVVFLLNRLAKSLIRQEELALLRGQALAIQQAINRLVFADMGDGILVVDQDDQLFEINPAAERMLGLVNLKKAKKESNERPSHLNLRDLVSLRPIADALLSHRDKTSASTVVWLREEDATFVSIRQELDDLNDLPDLSLDMHDGLPLPVAALGDERAALPHSTHQTTPHQTIHLKLRFASIDQSDLSNLLDLEGSNAAYTVIFMQDVSDIENQAQQLKLASMGRLTASIAHEVRNPLSSISYAASLLAEDMKNEVQTTRLLKIVDDNVQRLNQLIEDILKLSRKVQADTQPYLIMDVVKEITLEFLETRKLPPSLISLDLTTTFLTVFDPAHLREVVVNLLSNAVRYASGKPGCIRIYAKFNQGLRQELHIQDDGPSITAEVRSHLFEPFYTTSHKGTGLGLYMARELCLNNHALLDYDFRADDITSTGIELKGRFVINFSISS